PLERDSGVGRELLESDEGRRPADRNRLRQLVAVTRHRLAATRHRSRGSAEPRRPLFYRTAPPAAEIVTRRQATPADQIVCSTVIGRLFCVT
ncbi:hypothetical protein, partial [Frankia sp. AvcI1]|uniref:hypothetical protein n=1 Tax=Frankia sp. AvcI1 TaxID=573496 RepID=UPI001F2F8916